MAKVLPKLKEDIIANGFSEQIADWSITNIEPFVGYGLTNSNEGRLSFEEAL